MDLNFTAEEQAFRQEVRDFLRAKLPAELSSKVLGGKRMEKGDFVRWQKILFEKGWIAAGWPVEYGGTGWSPIQRYIFEEESAAAGAPRLTPFGLIYGPHFAGMVGVIAAHTENSPNRKALRDAKNRQGGDRERRKYRIHRTYLSIYGATVCNISRVALTKVID